MFAYSKRPQKISEVFRDGLQIYRLSFSKAALLAFIASIPSALHYALTMSAMPSLEQPGQIPAPIISHIFLLKNIILSIMAMIIWGFFMAAMINRMNAMITGEDNNINRSLQVAMSKFPRIAVALIIYFVIGMLGSVVFILPGIFLFVLLIFYLPLIVIDNESIFGSISRSAQLVWGNWWRTFIVILVPAIVMAIPNFFVTQFNLVTRVFIEMVWLTLFLPWMNAVILAQLNNLKLRYAEAHSGDEEADADSEKAPKTETKPEDEEPKE